MSYLWSFIYSFLLSIVIIPLFIKYFKSLDFSANHRLEGYQELSQEQKDKQKTPIMGGVPVFLSIASTTLYLSASFFSILLLSAVFLFLLIGFWDDRLKIIHRQKKGQQDRGLSEKKRLILEFFIAIIFYIIFLSAYPQKTEVFLFKSEWGNIVLFSILFIAWKSFIIVGTANAVNFTDGLDGLATGLLIICLSALLVPIALIPNETSQEIMIQKNLFYLVYSSLGALLAFLIFNKKPAKIFLGDTGSLFLGALLALVATTANADLIFALIGFVFVLEILSVIAQRFYYKRTKKRLFLMAPIHHHFEKKGYSEVHIVKLFYCYGLIASLFAMMVLFF